MTGIGETEDKKGVNRIYSFSSAQNISCFQCIYSVISLYLDDNSFIKDMSSILIIVGNEKHWTVLIFFPLCTGSVFYSDCSCAAGTRSPGLHGVAPDEAGPVGPGDRERAERHLFQGQHANPAAAAAPGTTRSALCLRLL